MDVEMSQSSTAAETVLESFGSLHLISVRGVKVAAKKPSKVTVCTEKPKDPQMFPSE